MNTSCRVWLIAVAIAIVFPARVRSQTTDIVSPSVIERASCAASTCHGGAIGRGESWASSWTVWADRDPHANAGITLYSDLSTQIVFALDPKIAAKQAAGDGAWLLDRDNLLRRRCLSCHATAQVLDCQPSGERIDSLQLAGGVSCQSCHGRADQWLHQHYLPGFATSNDADPIAAHSKDSNFKISVGMLDTETIVGRSSRCVRCHVGSRDADGLIRDMNHDMIAAGHPVLRFELGTYNEALPKHWSPNKGPFAFSKSPVQVRQAGRAITLAAAAKLAAQRAADYAKGGNVPWPELADYDCFACHQSLSMEQYRLPPDAKPSALQVSSGLPIWNSWHTVGQREFNETTLKALAPNAVDADRMAASGIKLANTVRAEGIAIAQNGGTDAKVELDRLQQTPPPSDWYEAAVFYLDAEAALREFSAGKDEPYRRFLNQSRPLLQFDSGVNSPGRFDPAIGAQLKTFLNDALKP